MTGMKQNREADLDAYLDNMPFSRRHSGPLLSFQLPQAWRTSLHSTAPVLPNRGHAAAGLFQWTPPEFRWMRQEFPKATAPWVIPYYHHPVFNAGASPCAQHARTTALMPLFQAAHVHVVFNGHEHNFQVSESNQLSFGIRFITSGAGGELRQGSVRGKNEGFEYCRLGAAEPFF